VPIQIQFKRGVLANRPALASGEGYWATDTNQFFIGPTPTLINSSSGSVPNPLQIAAIADPASPPSGNLDFYCKDIAGRIMPKWVGPSGIDTPFQAFIGFNGIRQLAPSGGTTATTVAQAFGCGYTAVGSTFASPVPATGSLLSRTCRWTQATSTTAGNVASIRLTTVQCSRETGFFYAVRFFLSGTLQSGQRQFVGMWDSSAAATNVDPKADTTRAKLGMGYNVNSGNWALINNTSGSAPTVLDLGASFPLNTTDLLELVLYSRPGDTQVSYRITNCTSLATTSAALTTNLPASTVMLCPQVWVTNNATAAASTMGLNKIYLETDF
jgi:hypothetical protein